MQLNEGRVWGEGTKQTGTYVTNSCDQYDQIFTFGIAELKKKTVLTAVFYLHDADTLGSSKYIHNCIEWLTRGYPFG